MRRFRYRPRERPRWWPENEPWPPTGPMRRHPFFRRMGCAFAVVNLFVWGFFIYILATVARQFGWMIGGGEPVPVHMPAVVGMVLAAVLAIAFAGWGLRRIVMPLDDLVEAADRLAQGDYSVRVRERGSRAVGSLARAFNNMAARLDSVQSDRRNLLADVTHEMRTPLTVIQGNLEGMLDGVYPANETNLRLLLDETALLSRVIDDLRTLALAESGALALRPAPTDMDALLHEAIAPFQGQAASQGVGLSVDVAAGTPAASLDAGRIRQVLTNLLANALRYTRAGGSVRLSGSQRDGSVIVEVQDTGAGIPPEDLPHVFERFYRSTDSGGMGLGLAIARDLVEAHGGRLTASSEPGRGTTMRMELPATAP